jgi:toxin ParE1/3/4
MVYKVQYSDDAEQDIENIFNYIADVLVEPVTAYNQTMRIRKAIKALDITPFGRRVFDREPWKSQGVRFFPVDNYLVFYKPDEADEIIKIIKIVHSKVDVERFLPIEN